MQDKLIKTTRIEQVFQISLNRPEVLNSFNRDMARELQRALNVAESDPQLRSVLLSAEGRAFCAGQDLADVAPKPGSARPDLGKIVAESYNPIIRSIRTLKKPVVCAVNGVAAGAGANLALCCDIVIASSEASFIQSFSKVGLIPDSSGTYFLPRLIGLAKAQALMLTAQKVSATEAEQLGMIYKVCAPTDLAEQSLALAQNLAELPTHGLWLTKRALNSSFSNSLDEQLKLEEELQREAGETYDYSEGVNAFLEKRKPVFIGK